jgi:hypothetical protein
MPLLTVSSQVVVVGLAIAMLIATPIFKDRFIIAPATLQESVTNFEALSIFGLMLIVLAVWGVRLAPKAASLAGVYAVALVCIVQSLALSAPPFGAIYSNPRQAREYDVYRAAVEMVRIFAKYATPSHLVLLWYASGGKHYSMGSIASTVLLYGVNEPFKTGGLPDVGEYEISVLRSPQVKYIMMLSQSAEAIASGKDALTRNGFGFRDVEHRTIGGANFKANLDLIELSDAPRGR